MNKLLSILSEYINVIFMTTGVALLISGLVIIYWPAALVVSGLLLIWLGTPD